MQSVNMAVAGQQPATSNATVQINHQSSTAMNAASGNRMYQTSNSMQLTPNGSAAPSPVVRSKRKRGQQNGTQSSVPHQHQPQPQQRSTFDMQPQDNVLPDDLQVLAAGDDTQSASSSTSHAVNRCHQQQHGMRYDDTSNNDQQSTPDSISSPSTRSVATSSTIELEPIPQPSPLTHEHPISQAPTTEQLATQLQLCLDVHSPLYNAVIAQLHQRFECLQQELKLTVQQLQIALQVHASVYLPQQVTVSTSTPAPPSSATITAPASPSSTTIISVNTGHATNSPQHRAAVGDAAELFVHKQLLQHRPMLDVLPVGQISGANGHLDIAVAAALNTPPYYKVQVKGANSEQSFAQQFSDIRAAVNRSSSTAYPRKMICVVTCPWGDDHYVLYAEQAIPRMTEARLAELHCTTAELSKRIVALFSEDTATWDELNPKSWGAQTTGQLQIAAQIHVAQNLNVGCVIRYTIFPSRDMETGRYYDAKMNSRNVELKCSSGTSRADGGGLRREMYFRTQHDTGVNHSYTNRDGNQVYIATFYNNATDTQEGAMVKHFYIFDEDLMLLLRLLTYFSDAADTEPTLRGQHSRRVDCPDDHSKYNRLADKIYPTPADDKFLKLPNPYAEQMAAAIAAKQPTDNNLYQCFHCGLRFDANNGEISEQIRNHLYPPSEETAARSKANHAERKATISPSKPQQTRKQHDYYDENRCQYDEKLLIVKPHFRTEYPRFYAATDRVHFIQVKRPGRTWWDAQSQQWRCNAPRSRRRRIVQYMLDKPAGTKRSSAIVYNSDPLYVPDEEAMRPPRRSGRPNDTINYRDDIDDIPLD